MIETCDVWSALIRWKRAREAFQAHATYATTHAYCDAVEALEELVGQQEAEVGAARRDPAS